MLNTSRKTITSVAFSADGRYLATGECGHQPSVRAFSPNHKHVVSVGTQHDMIVNVWDWRAGVKVASNKISTKVKAVSFADNGSYFVTVGNRHYKEPVPLMGRSAILGEQRNNYFCDVGCGRGEMGDSTYAITKSGLLCEFNNRRLLDKWVELRSFLYHSACIWGVEMYPELPASLQGTIPPGSFLTCSSDDTIRVWHLDPSLPADSQYQRNIYSNDLDVSATSEKPDSSYDGRNGVRSIRVSPDGAQLASGDRAGNVRIHDLRTVEEVCRIEAHDAEVLCLEYSQHDSGHRLLASASRDRLIHVFNVDQDYNFLQTLDDHSSSITAVRFLQQLGQLGMASCGADKSIIFRQLQPFARGHNVAGKTTLYDMEVDAGQKHVLTACQDRNIRVYNVSSGKHSKTFKGSASEDGSLIKQQQDYSVGPLPLWAKKQMQQDPAPNLPPRQMDLPKGRWAQRLDAGGITVKSVYDRLRAESDGSKDSQPGDSAMGKVNFSRGSEMQDRSGSRPLTDESSLGSYRYERRHKKARPERLTDLPSIAVSGSQESDEDDEEASTPSAETAERNLLSLLSVSSESLDRMGQREQFLKNNFESLSGAEHGVGPGGEEGGTSISSQFLTRSGVAPRNVALITAARQTRQDAESVRRREELQRRIEDTRRKLQSVGYRSGLSSSQSITDLSHIPEKDFNASPMRLQAGYNSSRASQEDSSGGGLRRAISLSDLSAPAPRRPNSLHVSGKVSSNSSRPGPGTGTRTLPRPGHKSLGPPPSSGMSRSSSVGVLNQSEDDPLRSRPLAARHTISSQNKMAATQAARERRRAAALSASAGNLQGMQAPGTEDSSSEEAAPTPPMQSLGRTAREVTQRLAGGGKNRAPAPPPPAPSSRANMEVSPEELPVKDTDMDIATAPITLDLCQRAAEQLTLSAEALATLHKRASVEIEPSERASLLQTLGAAAIQAQRTLRMVAPGTPSMNEAQPASGDMVHMMQQYSDMLVSIVQQRMAKPPPSS
ncbi:hypothetical protein B566_EDAN013207 [Ephemera danica]|nr:hypothetical protein B566_EDAN013207 [Ephemera danica]